MGLQLGRARKSVQFYATGCIIIYARTALAFLTYSPSLPIVAFTFEDVRHNDNSFNALNYATGRKLSEFRTTLCSLLPYYGTLTEQFNVS